MPKMTPTKNKVEIIFCFHCVFDDGTESDITIEYKDSKEQSGHLLKQLRTAAFRDAVKFVEQDGLLSSLTLTNYEQRRVA